MKKLLCISILIVVIFRIYSQTYNQQQYELLAVNVVFSGILSGVGACFTSQNNEKLYNTFFKGFEKEASSIAGHRVR